jgi:hypothetical protein
VSVEGNVARVLPVRRIEGATLVVSNPTSGTKRYPFNAYPDRPATIQLSSTGDTIEVLGADGKSLLKGEPIR